MDFRVAPEQEGLRATAREVAEREFAPRAAQRDRAEDYPWDNVKRLVALGLMGMMIPEALGGPGAPVLDAFLCIEGVARACAAPARRLGPPAKRSVVRWFGRSVVPGGRGRCLEGLRVGRGLPSPGENHRTTERL